MQKLKVGSLFSGIGGLELGLERTGHFETAWQVEIEPYATRVLKKHWPKVPHYPDIRNFAIKPEEIEGLKVDLLCGGFPCQDVSNAKTAQEEGPKGLEGEKSGLWYEYERVIRTLRPRWVIIENVGALNIRGLSAVLWGLASQGYDAEWATISAASLGAPHLRKRLFIVAFQNSLSPRLQRHVGKILAQSKNWRQDAYAAGSAWGDTTPRLRGDTHGLPKWMDRLRCCGNAVVPQVATFIGKRIIRAEEIIAEATEKKEE